MFADDVELCLKIVNDVDLFGLHSAINALHQWAELWQMTVSVDKFCAFRVGKVVLRIKILQDGTALS